MGRLRLIHPFAYENLRFESQSLRSFGVFEAIFSHFAPHLASLSSFQNEKLTPKYTKIEGMLCFNKFSDFFLAHSKT